MTVTVEDVSRVGDSVRVEVSSDLEGPRFYWYADGAFVGSSTEPARSFGVAPGEQLRVEVLDSTDADFDALANAPAGYPSRRSLWWTRSSSSDVSAYVVEQQKDGGDWLELARVAQEPGAWALSFLTGRLEDLATYSWRITPIDRAGNEGTATTFGPELVVRRPDAPEFALSFDAGANRVTISEAA